MALSGLVPAQDLDSLVSPGPLSKAHAEFSGLNNCQKCHVPGQGVAAESCLACHKEIGERIAAARGFHKDKATDCSVCHPEHRGESAQLIDWEPESFDHRESGFALEGLHQQVQACVKCHRPERAPKSRTGLSYLLPDSKCVSCHEDVHRGQLGSDCLGCHSMQTPFKQVKFDHSKASFQLLGAHQLVKCQSCHSQGRWTGIKHSRCADCHTDPHRPSLGPDCTSCHNLRTWHIEGARTRFHLAGSSFPLEGKHADVGCEKCHREGRFKGIAFDQCRQCHTPDPHFGQFQQDCSFCHDVNGFDQTSFAHERSRFSLTGKHVGLACAKCHTREQREREGTSIEVTRYRPLPTECSGCHADRHLGQFEAPCRQCHSTGGFGLEFLTFDHNREASFKLEGRHVTLPCAQCHKSSESDFPAGRGTAVRFVLLPHACADCHRDAHRGRLGIDCVKCHTQEKFRPAPLFSHMTTRFPLTGSHESLACRSCHTSPEQQEAGMERVSLDYWPAESSCRSCHQDPHSRPAGSDCTECHSTKTFDLRFFNHFKTSFPLLEQHASQACNQCHPQQKWKEKTTLILNQNRDRCTDCHRSPHRAQYRECRRCHTENTWSLSDF